MSDRQIVENIQTKLSSVNKEIEEVYELEADWEPKEDWHLTLRKLQTKKYLLEEMLEINE